MSNSMRYKLYESCMLAFEACIPYCAMNGYTRCLQLCKECSELCSLGMRLEAQNAVSAIHFFNLCKEICVLCANECLIHATLHKSCMRCYMACKSMIDYTIE